MYDSSFFTLRYRYRELLSSFLSTSVPSTNDRYALIWNCKRSNTDCIRKKRHTQNTSRQQTTPKKKQIRQLIMRNLLPLIRRLLTTFSYSALNIAGSWLSKPLSTVSYCYRWSLFHRKAKSIPEFLHLPTKSLQKTMYMLEVKFDFR